MTYRVRYNGSIIGAYTTAEPAHRQADRINAEPTLSAYGKAVVEEHETADE